MSEPTWARVNYGPIDYQSIYYYSAPKKKDGPKSLDEIDPEILKTYEKLGIPLREVAILEGVEPAPGAFVAIHRIFVFLLRALPATNRRHQHRQQ